MNQHHSGVRKGTRKGTRRESEGLWDWNLKSNRIHFSPRWISLIGYQDQEVGNTPDGWFDRVHPEDIEQVLREIESVRADGSSEFTLRYRLRHRDGSYRWMSSDGLVVRDDSGEAISLTGTQSDITVETVTDALTGLPNRLLLVDRVTQSIERAHRYKGFQFALLLIEIGRPAGLGRPSGGTARDPLLSAVARRLETCLRIPDMMPSLRHNDLVARVKGDLFAVLLDGLKDLGHAKAVADRILAELLNPFTLSGREVHVSAAIGIAVSATGYAHAEEALRDAETAVHRAQVLGGSHCEVFDTAILKSEQADLQLEGEFESALQRREFELLYEPVVSIASNQIVGFEALVRWRHPVLGVLAPLDFIPIAERTGFIVPLGRWIVQEACSRLQAWQTSLSAAKDVWVAVNVSGLQLRDPALVEQIEQALRDSGLPPGSLVLELTEGMAMENPTAVATLLMRLRAMGIRISVDDFGTGYSSLAYLRQFPVDALKIDRSFVRCMDIDKDTAEIVGGLTSMAQRLGLHTVAEGVEKDSQLALLKSLGCEFAQGYLFTKPLDVDSAGAMLKTGVPPRRPRGGREKVAVSPRHAGRMRPWASTVMPARGRAPVIAGTALVLVMAAAVVSVVFGRRQPVQTSLVSPIDDGRESRAGTLAVVEKEPAPARAQVGPHLPARSGSIGPSVPTAPNPSSVQTSDPPGASATSVDVVHLHRMGSCRGQLRVSHEGVAFVPDQMKGKDAFTLRHSDFLPTFADSTLTIQSAARTYRFKVAGNGKDKPPALGDLVERIARLRAR
jgi:diguanylate cyclase (GGDEF)-like protein/PAS domain S-box-containing protein